MLGIEASWTGGLKLTAWGFVRLQNFSLYVAPPLRGGSLTASRASLVAMNGRAPRERDLSSDEKSSLDTSDAENGDYVPRVGTPLLP